MSASLLVLALLPAQAATTGSSKAVMSSPASGATLSGASVTFAWSAGADASGYWLDVGTTQGANDISGQNAGLATSQTVSGIPTNGGTIYVRLWTSQGVPPNVTWQYIDYTYTAAGAAGSTGTKAVMTSPAPGTTLSGASVTFTWNAGSGASAYWLDVGTVAGGFDLFSQSAALATSQTVTGLPTGGSKIYVRLWTASGGVWQYNDYTYTAASAAGTTSTGGSTTAKAVMTSPAPGTTLSGASATFTWSPGSGAVAYWLDLGTVAGASNLFSQSMSLGTSQTVSGLPTDGSTIYVRLWTGLSGAWQYNDYTYTAASGSTLAKGGVVSRPPAATGPLSPTLASATTSAPSAGSAAVPGPATIARPTPGSAIAPASIPSLLASPATLSPAAAPHPFVAPVRAAPTAVAAPASSGTALASQTPALLANFPVLTGAVRIAFSSSRSKSTCQERGNYNAALAPDSAINTYAQQLAAAGWNEISRAQSGDAAAHTLQFTLDVQKDQTRGHIVLTQNAGGSGVAATVTTIYPGNSAPALSTGTTAAPAAGAISSASDRGSGDPADFPRLPGSIRTSFTTTKQATSTRDVATYTAKCAPAAADAFYAQNLPGAGWDEITRYEDVNDATKSDQITMTWQNAARSAVLALSGSTAGGADVRVTVNTQITP